MSIAQALAAFAGKDKIVVVRKPFVRWTGSIEAAMFLDQALFWWEAAGSGPFYKSDEEWSEDLPGISRYAIRKAREHLQEMGVLLVSTARHPSLPSNVTWYDIDRDVLDRSFSEWINLNSQLSETVQSTVRNQTVEDPKPYSRPSEIGQSYKEEATPTASPTASQKAAAADAREARTTAAATGQPVRAVDDDSEDAEPDIDAPLTVSDAVGQVAFGHVDAVPRCQRAELERVARLLERDGYDADDVLDADEHWRRGHARRHDGHEPTPAKLTQVYTHCAEWRRVQPAGPLFDDEPADYSAPDLPAWPPPANPAPPTNPAAIVWSSIKADLQLQMARATYDAWLKQTWAVELDGDALVVEVSNEATRDWLTSRLGSTLRETVTRVAGESITWRFVVAEREAVMA